LTSTVSKTISKFFKSSGVKGNIVEDVLSSRVSSVLINFVLV
jgi:hypothetical protein